MHNYETRVLLLLAKGRKAGLPVIAEGTGLSREQALWALHGLEEKGFVKLHYSEREELRLTPEGSDYAENGLPESRLLRRIRDSPVNAASLNSAWERIGMQWLMKKKLAQVANGSLRINGAGLSALKKEFPEEHALKQIHAGAEQKRLLADYREEINELRKRGLVELEGGKEFSEAEITGTGKEAAKTAVEEEEIWNIDREMIARMLWKGKKFAEYDVSAEVERAFAAKKHMLKQVMDRIKDSYVSMGFREISGPTIESAFWVFDSLFMPQDHPARDKQDTFYLDNPKEIELREREYVKEIKAAHERGWKYPWDIDRARQSVLRVHTTSVSARFVHQAIAKILSKDSDEKLPIKAFSMGRMFRNENIDYKHLADFYQHDGIIIGKDLTMANLFDVLIRLYGKLGIKLKFRPSYFPFVEPGAEFYGFSELNNEWVELGGSGIMRSEVTGISRDKINVLAWGAGVERVLLMTDNGIRSVTELYNNGIDFTRNSGFM